MSFAGFKKQLNKANQLLTEKIGGAKGTELDHEFLEMERKIDVTSKMIEEVVVRTAEFLQPNPASRARLTTVNTFNKLQGKAVSTMYPQPEGHLSECLIRNGRELGDDSHFGACLAEAGDSFRQLADIKYTLEDNARQNFLDPLQSLQNQELKEINHHRKKLQSRRLDFDCKKRKQEKGPHSNEEEIRIAEEKFEDSKRLAESSMINFLDSDAEHMQALAEFINAEQEYHTKALQIMNDLQTKLEAKMSEAKSRPRTEPSSSARRGSWEDSPESSGIGGMSSTEGASPSAAEKPAFVIKSKHDTSNNAQIPTARALYDFVPDNSTELGFDEGDIVKLIQQIDENWFLGEFKGKQGHFPVNYVEVLVALP